MSELSPTAPDAWTRSRSALRFKWSPDAALRAVRAAVVMPALFAITLEAIGNLQLATLTAFGSFATLVLASFGGSRRDKLVAHTGLALTGAVLVVIGTAVGSTSSAAVGAVVTVPVAFVVFYAGIAGPNAAAAATAALLAYVLPAASAGTMSVVGDRVAGWLLASAVGTAAVLATSPREERDDLRAAGSRLAVLLADQLRAALDGTATRDTLQAVIDGKHDLLARFGGAVYKPTGLAAPAEALASAIELLEWCASMVSDMAHEGLDLQRAAEPDRQLFAAAAAVLRDSSALLTGGTTRPDLEQLGRVHSECLTALLARPPDGGEAADEARLSFHANAIAVAVRTIGANTLVAAELADSEWYAEERRWLFGLSAGRSLVPRRASRLAAVARRDASLGSVWLVNSLRGAIALAAAITIADVSNVQHGFWVVLGTLSVLRTNAASTGATAVRALTGTAIGFVIGGALLLAIGSGSGALWAVLPVAVLVAAYAPGTLPFVVGQAGFTVTVAVLFNLLVPVGWRVGVVRVEDVAIGSAVSVVIGSVLWPHGVARLVARDIGDAFRTGAAYLGQAVSWASGSRASKPDNTRQSVDAGLRLSDAVRGFLTERGTKELSQRDLWLLLGGSMRLRLTARGIAELPGDAVGNDAARGVLMRRTRTLTDWYDHLVQFVAGPLTGPMPALSAPQFAPEDIVDESSGSLYGVWLCEFLDHLAEHLGDLIEPAQRALAIRRKPWWR